MPPRVVTAPFQGIGLIVPKATLGADSATWTITIPASIYSNLKIFFTGRTDGAAANERLLIRPNNNTTLTNLLGNTIFFVGGAVSGEEWRVNELSSIITGNIAGATNYQNGVEIDIYNYQSTTKNKAIHVSSDYTFSIAGASGGFAESRGSYIDLNSITSVVFACSGVQKILAGSTYVVYGF